MERTSAVSTCYSKGMSRGYLSNIEDGLELSVSDLGKERISGILENIESLSDVEKLLLYLKLPTGSASDDVLRQTPTSFLHASNRLEQAQAFTWIRSHLEEDSQICVPKHEVYDDYRAYCDSHGLKTLCPADFGKVLKCIFPNVKPRRLGQRGQSRYCYSGLRKKLDIEPPSLPELEISPKKPKTEDPQENELFAASCQLVCEWAGKLLSRGFTSLRELSEYLVGNLYVNSKSTAAFTVLAAMQEAGLQNSRVPVSPLFTCSSGGDKHRETQLQLQRKLQERELLKEQKKKLQQQRTEIEQEQLRSVSRGPTATPTKSPLPRAFTKTPTPIKSPTLRPPSRVALKSPVTTFRQTPTLPSTQNNVTRSAARNITKLLQSPVHYGRPASKPLDIKLDTSLASVPISIQSDEVKVVMSIASSVSSMSVSENHTASVSSVSKPTTSGASPMQLDCDSGYIQSRFPSSSSQPVILMSSINGEPKLFVSTSQSLAAEEMLSPTTGTIKNGLHVVQKPVVVTTGSGIQPSLSSTQVSTIPASADQFTFSSITSNTSVTNCESGTTRHITIVTKPKTESANRDTKLFTAADLERSRIENVNFTPGNLSSRSAFVPVLNQKLAFAVMSGKSCQASASESSSDESKEQEEPLVPMDHSESLGHSGGFESISFDARGMDQCSTQKAAQVSDVSNQLPASTPCQQSGLKKVKNRFTPIRPKVPQPVTPVEKEEKTPPKEKRQEFHKVSSSLKEKREAQEILAHIASSFQSQTAAVKNFPAGIALPAELLGLSPDKIPGQNDIVIILTSPSTGNAKAAAASGGYNLSKNVVDIATGSKQGSVAFSMSDILIANPNFIPAKSLQTPASSSSSTNSSMSAVHNAQAQSGQAVLAGISSVNVPRAEMHGVVLDPDHHLIDKFRLDSGCLDVSDSSETGNTTDEEEMRQHMENSKLLLPESRDADTPSSRKRKSSGQGSLMNKRLNSTEKRNDEDDDVFIVEPGPQSELDLHKLKEISASEHSERLVEFSGHTFRRHDLNSHLDHAGFKISPSPVGDAVSRCHGTSIGMEDMTYLSMSSMPSAELAPHVRGKLSVESLESDALLDSSSFPVSQDLVVGSSSHNQSFRSGQKSSIGISAQTMHATQKALIQQKQQLDARIGSFVNKGVDNQTILQLSKPQDTQTKVVFSIDALENSLSVMTSETTLQEELLQLFQGYGGEKAFAKVEDSIPTTQFETQNRTLVSASSKSQHDTIAQLLQELSRSSATQQKATDENQLESHLGDQNVVFYSGLESVPTTAPTTTALPASKPGQQSFLSQPLNIVRTSSKTNVEKTKSRKTGGKSATSSSNSHSKTAKSELSDSEISHVSSINHPVNLLALLKSPALSSVQVPSSIIPLQSGRKTTRVDQVMPQSQQVQSSSYLSQTVQVVQPVKMETDSKLFSAGNLVTSVPSVPFTLQQSETFTGNSLSTNVSTNLSSGISSTFSLSIPSTISSCVSSNSSSGAPSNLSLNVPSNYYESSSSENAGHSPSDSHLSSEAESELPADVADFVAEAMTAQALKMQQNPECISSSSYIQSFLFSSDNFLDAGDGDKVSTGGNANISEVQKVTFPVPSNPAPKQRMSESGSIAAKKFPQVQRSSSLPMFVPQVIGNVSLEIMSPLSPSNSATSPRVPASSNSAISPRVPAPSNPGPLTSNIKPARRQRQVTDRGNSQVSDGGYHSIDSSPSVSTASVGHVQQDHYVIGSVSLTQPTSACVQSDYGVSRELLQARSPILRTSPHHSIRQKTRPNSVTGNSPVNEGSSSPNAFMPIQASVSVRSGFTGQQYIEPIRPMVALASAAVSTTSIGASNGSSLNREIELSSQNEITEVAQPCRPPVSRTPSATVHGTTLKEVVTSSFRLIMSDADASSELPVSIPRTTCVSPRPGTVAYTAPATTTSLRQGGAPSVSPGPSPTPPSSVTVSSTSTSPAPVSSRTASHGVLQKLLSTRTAPPSYAESVQQRRMTGTQYSGNQIVGGKPDVKMSISSPEQKISLGSEFGSNNLSGTTTEQLAGQFTVPIVSAEDIMPKTSLHSVVHHTANATTSNSSSTNERPSRRINILKRDSSAKPSSKSSAKATAESLLKANLSTTSVSASPETIEYPFSYKLALLRQQSMNQVDTEAPSNTSAQAGSTGNRGNKPQATASAALAARVANLQKQLQASHILEPANLVGTSAGGGVAESQQSKGSVMSTLTIQVPSPLTPSSVSIPSSPAQSQPMSVSLRPSPSSQSQSSPFFNLPLASPSQRVNPFSPSQSSSSSMSPAAYLPFNLPDMNYMGNAPNIDLSQLLPNKSAVITSVQPPQPTSNPVLNITGYEDELQSTLEILRNMDGQYFNQEVEGDGGEGDNSMLMMQSVFSDFSNESEVKLAEEGNQTDEEDLELKDSMV